MAIIIDEMTGLGMNFSWVSKIVSKTTPVEDITLESQYLTSTVISAACCKTVSRSSSERRQRFTLHIGLIFGYQNHLDDAQ